MTIEPGDKDFPNSAAPPVDFHGDVLEEAFSCLSQGEVVAIPTDTLFGLAADVRNEGALRHVFDIKGRPDDLALPVLVAGWDQASMVARVEDNRLGELAAAFWPGSLTLVLPKQPNLSTLVTGGRETVAVRMPGHWVPLNLARRLGAPITGTSANRSGQQDLKSPAEIWNLLGDSVCCVVEAGPPPGGVQSTIVDLTGGQPALLREGATPFADVMRVWQEAGAHAHTQDPEGG